MEEKDEVAASPRTNEFASPSSSKTPANPVPAAGTNGDDVQLNFDDAVMKEKELEKRISSPQSDPAWFKAAFE